MNKDCQVAKKVLIVSFYFSPINTIGSLRISKLAKYLSQFGWEPWILTVDNQLYKYTNDLQTEVPENHIFRADYGNFLTNYIKNRNNIKSEKPSKNSLTTSTSKPHFLTKFAVFLQENRFPDRYLPWYMPAYKLGKTILANQKFDVILSSFSPPASHIVAHFLAKKYKIPWVADYRDLWTMNHDNQRKGLFGLLYNKFEVRFEKYILQNAETLITVSEPLKIQLENLHRKKVNIITNGYDHEDYNHSILPISKRKTIQITYTGNIYKGKQSPKILFKAIKNLISRKMISIDDFEINFYGTNPEFVDLTDISDFSSSVKFYPRISHVECVKKQMNSDILLLLQWNDPDVRGFYSGKVFEYLGAKKPILAVGIKGGVISELLNETKSGHLVSDVMEAEAILANWVELYKRNGYINLEGNIEEIKKYTRLNQANDLASILNSALTK